MAIELKEFGAGTAYLKGGLYGSAGSGKTFTAAMIAVYVKKFFGLKGDIYFFDTETGAEYVNPYVKAETGRNIVGVKSRTLADAVDFIKQIEEKDGVGIMDSVTHVTEEINRSFLDQLNVERARQGKGKRNKIEWHEREGLNKLQDSFSNAYLNARSHMLVCGREANIWKREENEDTGKVDLNVTGTKMKAASLSYEPGFLAEMAREHKYIDGVQQIVRTMTVMKCRFNRQSGLDGKQFVNPTGESILSHLKLLTPGAINEVDTTKQTPMDVSDEGDTKWAQERLNRTIACEKIQSLFVKSIPGRGALEQKAKALALEQVYGTSSWTQIETKIDSKELMIGLKTLAEIAIPAALEQIAADEKRDTKPARAEKVSAK